LLVDASIYDRFLEQLQKEGGYLVSDEEKKKLQDVMWDAEGHRTSPTIARPARRIAELAGFPIPDGKTFLIVKEENIGAEYPFSSEKLSPVLAIFRYSGFDNALPMVEKIYEVGGKGHSCGIYSFDDEHIHRLAMMAPVSRIMVRQPQSKANAGAFNNGMPMTSSMGCGTWGGNITSENIALKHYMNVTWVSRPIAEDRPSEQELFGEFYRAKTFA
jgi:sulfoacetaldehyde dehydrogenase